jgi:hypothetical protein
MPRGVPINPALLELLRKTKKYLSRDGYYLVCLEGRLRTVHRVVWEAWNGSIPPGRVVHHKNHNRADNRPENLELMTASDHSSHHHRHPDSPHGRRPTYFELKELRLCVTCARNAPLPGYVQCAGCKAKGLQSSMRSATMKKWSMQADSDRRCPRCHKPPRCKVAARVCDRCRFNHLFACCRHQMPPGVRRLRCAGLTVNAARVAAASSK